MKQYVRKPIISEKALRLANVGWYTFAADKAASKYQLIREISDLYKVTVTDIRTVRMHGKSRRAGRRMIHKQQPDWKKAIVRLKAGQTIDAFQMTSKETPKSNTK